MMKEKNSVISFAAGNCYSYLITDGGKAFLIDPHISLVEQYARKLVKKSLSLVGIFDTHTHADHISSAAILKKRYDVPVYMSEHANSSVATERVKDGDVIKVGETEVRAIYTPGHTDDSVSLVTGQGDVFTGDVLLIDSVGRVDFQNGSPEDMFDSLGKLAALDGETVVRPAHDYKGNTTSTIAEQRKANPFILEKDKNKFCDDARSKKMAKPANMDTIITVNQKGTAEGFSTVSAKEAFEKLAEPNSVLLDVRTDQELSEISVKADNVKHIPLQSLASSAGSLSNEMSYYTLCRSGKRATMAAMVLMEKGFAKVAVIDGGITAWEKAKLPVRKTAAVISLERQVRIIAGCLILIGSLLSFVNIWFIVIPLWVGGGLVYAGVSNNCLMASLLMKLPYNKKALTGGGGSCAIDGGGSCSM
ncbi:MAG: MBL fold metallo-hydrolase [Planctomycetota bacterium]|jgi:glyoxylase-like metal-dependent hydrolase (beta-lactamase superfamily II)